MTHCVLAGVVTWWQCLTELSPALQSFLVRKSARLQRKVLSLCVDDVAPEAVSDFPIRESQYSTPLSFAHLGARPFLHTEHWRVAAGNLCSGLFCVGVSNLAPSPR